VSGAFVQLKSNYRDWIEVITAARHDQYELNGGGVTSSGTRVSPKVTVGLMPTSWITPYATYAEGYRAPAVTETFVAGLHPVFPQFCARRSARPRRSASTCGSTTCSRPATHCGSRATSIAMTSTITSS
jgi:outer membrane receptor protein involved in Fe transport